MSLVDFLARLWAVKDPLPPRAELVALVSFGATPTRLTRGSRAALVVAEQLQRHYDAPVIYGTFAGNPVDGIEEAEKLSFFSKGGATDAVCVGKVWSTIEEAETIMSRLPRDLPLETIVIVTDEWHSRSERLVWRRVLEKSGVRARVVIVLIGSCANYDPENPMTALRTPWKWALVNVLRHMVLLTPGGMWMMRKFNIHQPVAR